MFYKKNLLGVGFTDEQLKDILEYVEENIKKKEKKLYIVTPNPEILTIANKNFDYKKVLNDADLALIDGIGIIVASRLLGKPLKHKISGVDFIEGVCKSVAEKPITIGFLGGGPGVAEKTAECLRKKYPGLKVAFSAQEWEEIEANSPHSTVYSKNRSVVGGQKSKSLSCDILLVAFGSPKQEIWIKEHLKNLPVTVAMGVGGAFDMISGRVLRAPAWIRSIGLEWLFRLAVQPWRIKRQLRLLEFIYLVLKEKFSPSEN